MHMQFLKDWHLMIVVLIFVIVDIIILTTVTAVDNARYTFLSVQDRENPPSVNVSHTMLNWAALFLG